MMLELLVVGFLIALALNYRPPPKAERVYLEVRPAEPEQSGGSGAGLLLILAALLALALLFS